MFVPRVAQIACTRSTANRADDVGRCLQWLHCSGSAANGRQDTPVGPSTGRSDVGGQPLVTPPIRGRARELKVIGALLTALVQGRTMRSPSSGLIPAPSWADSRRAPTPPN